MGRGKKNNSPKPLLNEDLLERISKKSHENASFISGIET
jgi:hypothetical protein